MVIDCRDPNDLLELYSLVEQARKKGKKLKVVYDRKVHTDPQRKYLHFCLSYFAHCYGCTLVEAKEMHLKRYACPELFDSGRVDKGGHKVLRSTTELTDVEYSNAISNFRAYADINGIPLPDPDDKASLRYCEREIEKTEIFGT
jgi:hypothetical protein